MIRENEGISKAFFGRGEMFGNVTRFLPSLELDHNLGFDESRSERVKANLEALCPPFDHQRKQV